MIKIFLIVLALLQGAAAAEEVHEARAIQTTEVS